MPDNLWKIRVLFVCMGNICRSPTCEGVFRQMLVERGLAQLIDVDSAGTHSYHVGSAPDRRAQRAALEQGIEIGHLRARQINSHDFTAFDHILVMDYDNLEDLRAICPSEYQDKLRLLMEYSQDSSKEEVPDPYYGGRDGFALVLKLAREASAGFIASLRDEVELTR